MNAHDVASIRRGIAAARLDRETLIRFYTGEYHVALFADFLKLGELFLDPLEGRAWKHTVCRDVHRFEVALSASSTPA